MCASCYPAAAPAATVAPARVRAAPRTPSARRSTTGAGPATSLAAPFRDDVSSQRAFHLTHIDNLAGILRSGSIFAPQSAGWDFAPAVDISSPSTREGRRDAVVTADVPVAEFVPFFLSPTANVWDDLRARRPSARLSAAATAYHPSEFVLLVTTVDAVWSATPSVAVADGDAAATTTRFAVTREESERMLRTLRADPEQERLLDAELLVHGSVAFELITLVGVAHDKARTRVREILAGAAHSPKLAVFPPWFAPGE
nr:DarT ssDNA thymidine ADP-ribosyltransferase family protein [Galbitalea soli]